MKVSAENVCLILLTYNSVQWLERFFSTLNETAGQVPVIVVDNASQDGTVEMVRKLCPDEEVIVNKKNLGYAEGMNLGAEEAIKRGAKVLGFLNPDIWFEKGWLEPVLKVLEHPSAGACAPYQLEYDSDEPNEWSMKIVGTSSEEETVEVPWVEGSCLFVRSEVFQKSGGFYSGFFMYYEDMHLCRMIRNMGYKCFVALSSRIHHRRHAEKRTAYMIRGHLIYALTDPGKGLLANLANVAVAFLQHIRDGIKNFSCSEVYAAFSGLVWLGVFLPKHLKRWREDRSRITLNSLAQRERF